MAKIDTSNSIQSLVRTNEQKYIGSTSTTISKYVQFDMFDTISRIEAYISSKHTSGSTDAMDRDKPFFDIVTSARNIWYRATDIDRKNIRIRPVKSTDTLGALLASIHLQDYMKRDAFGVFLNDWGRTLATYGSAVSKFVEKSGKLHASVIPWNRLIVDQVSFDNDVVIEKLELTSSQLKMNTSYDQELVDNLLDALQTRKTLDRQTKDTKSDFITIYEVHGNIALSYLTGNERDDNEFVQQMHVVTFVESKETGKFDDFTLVSGKEKKNPYMITHLMKEDGRTLSIGAVEHLFEAQWMQNWSVKTIKDQLDLASKLIYQTSDGNFVGQNALGAIENGDILIHEINQPLTQVNNGSHDITSVQSFASQWKALGNEINGISEAMMGVNPPSGSAWRQTEALLQESHSLFELYTENKGLGIEEMMRMYIIPHLKLKMNTNKEVSATLADIGVAQVERIYIKSEVIKRRNNAIVDEFRKGGDKFDIDSTEVESQVKEELSATGNSRFFKPDEDENITWKDIFKDLEWDVEVDPTGESADKQAALTTLNTTLQMILNKQGQPMTPTESFIVNKILTLTGEVSPIELAQLDVQQQPQPEMPQQKEQPVPSPIQPNVPTEAGRT